MRYSQLFGKTRKEIPKDATIPSHQLLLQGGFIHQTAAGIYSYLPLGFRVLTKIDTIIKEEFSKVGIQHLLMPIVHPATLWRETGRREKMDAILAHFEAAHGGEYLLAPTHEETVTDLARTFIRSYRDLPVIVNQNQWKYRDEVRVSGGLLRTREFLMQDAYSFDRDEEGMRRSFTLMSEAYHSVFHRIGLPTVVVRAESGDIGGTGSEEFMVLSESGEDRILMCDACSFRANVEVTAQQGINAGKTCVECRKGTLQEQRTIELGHVFQLGTVYSEPMRAMFTDEDGSKKPLVMGCYGIGISRVIAAAVEVSHDDRGIIWQEHIAPYTAHLLVLGSEEEVRRGAEELYEDLWRRGVETLYDDRSAAAGEKFADADLIGIPHRLVVSKKSLEKGGVEWKRRNEQESRVVKREGVPALFHS